LELKNTKPKLYNTLSTQMEGLGWRDQRHLQTFIWIVLGLIESGVINLTQWVPDRLTKLEKNGILSKFGGMV